ncbi:MAG TPA: phage tail tube protein [Micromonosporaceae bacterium]|nr:phage tail tube protein [Micromonosporaceae bacterium]
MAGLDAFGTKLKRGDGGAPEVFTPIAQVTKISGPEFEREILDVTDHDSVEAWEEAKGGIKRSGEVSLDINFDPSVHNTLLADLNDADARNYQLVFPDTPPSTWSFKAVMKGVKVEAPHDNKLTGTITFKISGKPTTS